MNNNLSTRRTFLQTTAAAAVTAPYFFSATQATADDAAAGSKNDRPVLGCIGTGSRWGAVGQSAMQFSDCAAVCDVDAGHLSAAANRVKQIQGREPEQYEDYRQVLDRKDIDVVAIVAPDHWHTKIAIEAMQAGKDVYCEKPLTLTIEEGRQIIKVLEATKRVFQVGTQQRSEMEENFTNGVQFGERTRVPRFLLAAALVRAGRIGRVERVQCAIGAPPTSGPIPVVDPPSHLNWEMWLGQAPLVEYRYKPNGQWGHSRCHYEFRWWYEYSGGKMTDWGAHHVDIAQWAIGMENTGPLSVEGTATHPVPFENGYPTDDTQYNAATQFLVKANFPNGVELTIRHDTDNGILFEGTEGRFFVNRGKIVGKPVEDLVDDPLPEDAISQLYGSENWGGGNAHMRNFFECLQTREQPVSDVHTHHRAMTTCHLANIAIRLGRPIKWNPITQQITGDDEANSFVRRQQREGYEIDLTV